MYKDKVTPKKGKESKRNRVTPKGSFLQNVKFLSFLLSSP
jgi:hypothetical protein